MFSFFSREAMQILDCFIISAFWSAMISYVALSLIKLYAGLFFEFGTVFTIFTNQMFGHF